MKLDDKKKKILKIVLAVALAAVLLFCTVSSVGSLIYAFGDGVVPAKVPDNSEFYDSSIGLPDESKTPDEFSVVAALISVEMAGVATVIYILLRKKL